MVIVIKAHIIAVYQGGSIRLLDAPYELLFLYDCVQLIYMFPFRCKGSHELCVVPAAADCDMIID